MGTIVYLIVRPPEYLDDVRERQLEIAAAEARLAQLDALTCPYCEGDIEKTFLRCPHCMRKLKDPCQRCGRPLDPRWRSARTARPRSASAAPRTRDAHRATARPAAAVGRTRSAEATGRAPADRRRTATRASLWTGL